MDDNRFDDVARVLGRSGSRRLALAGLGALSGFGMSLLAGDAKKKKKKKKKKSPVHDHQQELRRRARSAAPD